MQNETIALIQHYYECFNKQDISTFITLLDTNVVHDINQGETEVGINAFSTFMDRMNTAYTEKVTELVVMASEDGKHAAAEFFIEGIYKTTDKGLPLASNQHYRLRCGAFFEINQNKITRVTNYYNLQTWLKQVKE